MSVRKAVENELKPACATQLNIIQPSLLPVKPLNVISLVQMCIAAQDKLDKLGETVRVCYADIFSGIPHTNN